jgi:hypothetical protein
MRPATVHLLAQGLRFARGSLTEVEKWIAQTPPERIAAEAAEVLRLARHHLTKFEAVLSAAPMTRTSAETPTTDRPALTAIRSRTE